MAGQYLPINCHKHKLSIFLSPDVAGAEGILKFKYKIKCPIEIAYNEHPRQTVFHLWQWDAMNPRQLRTATEQDRETDKGREQRSVPGPQQIILEKRRELCTHLVWPLLMKMNSIRWVNFPHTEMQIPQRRGGGRLLLKKLVLSRPRKMPIKWEATTMEIRLYALLISTAQIRATKNIRGNMIHQQCKIMQAVQIIVVLRGRDRADLLRPR